MRSFTFKKNSWKEKSIFFWLRLEHHRKDSLRSRTFRIERPFPLCYPNSPMCPSTSVVKMLNGVALPSASAELAELLRNSSKIWTFCIQQWSSGRCVGNISPNLRYRNRPKEKEKSNFESLSASKEIRSLTSLCASSLS